MYKNIDLNQIIICYLHILLIQSNLIYLLLKYLIQF